MAPWKCLQGTREQLLTHRRSVQTTSDTGTGVEAKVGPPSYQWHRGHLLDESVLGPTHLTMLGSREALLLVP